MQAQPGNSWPGCPPDSPEGPCRWCPGDPPVQTGNLKVNPVVWDNNVCHTYFYVSPGQGNVANNIFEVRRPRRRRHRRPASRRRFRPGGVGGCLCRHPAPPDG